MHGHVTRSDSAFHIRLSVIIFIACIVQFSSAWFYPASTFTGMGSTYQDKFLGVPFQYTLWLLVLYLSFLDVKLNGFSFYFFNVKLFAPFIMVGFLASVFGVMPLESFRYLALYFVMFIAAVLPVAILPLATMRRLIYFVMLAIVIMSVFYAVLLPSYGMQIYSGQNTLRGFFTNKNQFGWFSALAFIVSVMFFDPSKRYRSFLFVCFPFVSLLWSESKGALVSAIVALVFVPVLYYLRRNVSRGLAVLIFSILLIFLILFAYFLLPELLVMLGRDVTLTGRTVIWGLYFKSMLYSPFLGAGPGSYTSLSELTLPLAYRLQEMGAILTPHNAYLAVFGESGVIGFACYVFILLYLGLYQYFVYSNIYSLACSAVAILLVIGGFSETHEIFSPGVTMYLIISLRAMAVKSAAPSTV